MSQTEARQLQNQEVSLNPTPLESRLGDLTWEISQLRVELRTVLQVREEEAGLTTFYMSAGVSAFLGLIGWLAFPGLVGILVVLVSAGPFAMSIAGLRLGRKYME